MGRAFAYVALRTRYLGAIRQGHLRVVQNALETDTFLTRRKLQPVAIAEGNALPQRNEIGIYFKFQCRAANDLARAGLRAVQDPAFTAFTKQAIPGDLTAGEILLILFYGRRLLHSGCSIATDQAPAKSK